MHTYITYIYNIYIYDIIIYACLYVRVYFCVYIHISFIGGVGGRETIICYRENYLKEIFKERWSHY